MIKVILWDVDGTLLDFKAAERAAIRACFARFGLGECSDGMLARYSAINQTYWERLERGEMTKEQILTERFREFFHREGIPQPDVDALNRAYQLLLGDTIRFHDNACDLVRRLRGRVRQYAASNGTRVAQEKKLRRSGLAELLDGAFISENVGAEKPSPAYFRAVLEQIGPCGRDEVLMVGDSLTSDMRGGNNAGVLCCWYNPGGAPLPDDLRIDFDIRRLDEVEGLLDFNRDS